MTKFYLSLHYNGDNSYLLVNQKEIFKFKACNENVNILAQFGLGSVSIEFNALDFREVSLKRNIYQGIIQKKSASGSRTLLFVIFDKKCPFCQK